MNSVLMPITQAQDYGMTVPRTCLTQGRLYRFKFVDHKKLPQKETGTLRRI